jgi:hypothetical protein
VEETDGMNPRNRSILAAAVVSITVCSTSIGILLKLRSDPEVIFLHNASGAMWIKFPQPSSLIGSDKGVQFVVFRAKFDSKVAPSRDTVLFFRALKVADVYLNGVAVYKEADGPRYWKRLHRIGIAQHIIPGENLLQINVANDFGPAALVASIPALGVATDANWLCSQDGQNWSPAQRADIVAPAPISREFPAAYVGFLQSLTVTVPLFGVIVFFFLFNGAGDGWKAARERLCTASHLRWAILAAVAILGVNNFLRLEPYVGMDSVYHYDYIKFLLEHKRLPLADEGHQMFRAPLPYVLYAGLSAAISGFFDQEVIDKIVRLVSVACGVAMVEICYRTMRHAYPGRRDLQSIGTLVGGLMPMSLYLSQAVGDEPLTGALGSLAILMSVRILALPNGATWRQFAAMGAAVGLAQLSKFTALLLIPPAIAVVVVWAMSQPRGLRRASVAFSAFTATYVLVSGWYYIRNYYYFGQLLVGGWDPIIGSRWWQDPNYRTLTYFTRFGEALRHPVYSALPSFWDGMYSQVWMDGALSGIPSSRYAPPWNYTSMFASAWWALVPTAAIVMGIARSCLPKKDNNGDDRRERILLPFAAGLLMLYLGAIVYHTVTVPYYSSTKASYMIVAAPALGLLAAAGCAPLMRMKIPRATLLASLACWAATVYAAYFVL